jgi:hypothetical protein
MIQTYLSIFAVLAVVALSGRTVTAADADHSAGALLNIAAGDLLMLAIVLGLIWVLPRRLMGKNPGLAPIDNLLPAIVLEDEPSGLAAALPSSASATGLSAVSGQVPGSSAQTSEPQGTGAAQHATASDLLILLAILPALLILVVGIVLYLG